MAAALFAAIDGASVLLVESTGLVGGSTAWSGGLAWVPGTHHAGFVHPGESINDARRYLDATVGSRSPTALREAFLKRGAAAVHRLERYSQVALRAAEGQPDDHPECPGAATVGRVLEPLAFDARVLGRDFALLRPPPPEALWLGESALGGLMIDATDRDHLRRWHRSAPSFAHVVKMAARHARDRLRHARGTQLRRGNALIAQLLASLHAGRVPLVLNTRATALHDGPSGIDGVTLIQDGCVRRVRARGGVILATGGFNRHPLQRGARLPDIDIDWAAVSPGNLGMGLSLAEACGAVYGTGASSNAYLAPVSLRRRRDGSSATFAHLQRAPRQLIVDADGDCVIDAGLPHHATALAMQETVSLPMHLVTDAQGMAAQGLGMVGPGGDGLAAALGDGYVRQALDLRDLARVLEVPAATLERELNRHARKAKSDFEPPFFAVEIFPGDIAAACGLATDADARVLRAGSQVLHGLYAIGADMHSVMGGVLPAPGCMLGPALVFASIAADHAAARAKTPSPADGADHKHAKPATEGLAAGR